MHMLNELLLTLIVVSLFFGVWNQRNMALAVAGGMEVGTACCSGGVGVENGFERGVSQEEQHRGRFPLGVTGSSVDQQCRTDYCAPKYARDSFHLTTSVATGFLFDTFSGVPRGRGPGSV